MCSVTSRRLPDVWTSSPANPSNPEDVLVQKLVRELEQSGTLDVLRPWL